jgi:hypothetical protein
LPTLRKLNSSRWAFTFFFANSLLFFTQFFGETQTIQRYVDNGGEVLRTLEFLKIKVEYTHFVIQEGCFSFLSLTSYGPFGIGQYSVVHQDIVYWLQVPNHTNLKPLRWPVEGIRKSRFCAAEHFLMVLKRLSMLFNFNLFMFEIFFILYPRTSSEDSWSKVCNNLLNLFSLQDLNLIFLKFKWHPLLLVSPVLVL